MKILRTREQEKILYLLSCIQYISTISLKDIDELTKVSGSIYDISYIIGGIKGAMSVNDFVYYKIDKKINDLREEAENKKLELQKVSSEVKQ